MKLCTKCGETKPLSDFHKGTGRKDGHASHCKVCSNERARQWNKNNPERKAYFRDRDNDKRTADRYNLSAQELKDLRYAAAGRCAICKRELRLVVDHDHETGRVRGMLCRRCNLGIGHLDDNPVTLIAALAYLSKNLPDSSNGKTAVFESAN